MANDPARELVAELGFDVDLTGADRFDSRFRKLSKTANGFGHSFNKSILEINKTLATLGLGGVGAIAGVVKSYNKFTDVLEAEREIKLRVGDQFDNLNENIEKAIANTGNFTKRIDALNALSIGEKLLGDQKFMTDNFETMIKLSAVLQNETLPGVSEQIASFIKSGGSLDFLERIRGITPQMREALKRSGTDFENVGMETRKKRVELIFSQLSDVLNKQFLEASKENKVSTAKLTTSIDNLSLAIGKDLSPSINNLQVSLAKDITRLEKAVRGDIGWLDFFFPEKTEEEEKQESGERKRVKALLGEQIERTGGFGVLTDLISIGMKAFEKAAKPFFDKLQAGQPLTPLKNVKPYNQFNVSAEAGRRLGEIKQLGNTTINNNITIQGSKDPKAVANEINRQSKRVSEYNARAMHEYSTNTTN